MNRLMISLSASLLLAACNDTRDATDGPDAGGEEDVRDFVPDPDATASADVVESVDTISEELPPEELCVLACADIPVVNEPEQPCGSDAEARDYCLDVCMSEIEGVDRSCAVCRAGALNWDAGCNDFECMCIAYVPAWRCEDVCP